MGNSAPAGQTAAQNGSMSGAAGAETPKRDPRHRSNIPQRIL